MAEPIEYDLSQRLFDGIKRLIELRKTVPTMVISVGGANSAKFEYDAFRNNFGRGEVRLKCQDDTGNKLLIIINNDDTARNAFEPARFHDLDSEIKAKTHKHKYEILMIRRTTKQHDRQLFPDSDIIEYVKLYEEIISNPIDHICGPREVEILGQRKKLADDSLTSLGSNLHADIVLPTLLRTDPLVFWIGAVVGDIVRAKFFHENVGLVPKDYLVK